MKKIVLCFVLTTFTKCLTAQYSGLFHQDNDTKKYLHTPSVDKKLFIKDRQKNRKRRIKIGATINFTLQDSAKSGVTELKLITDSGVFVTPIIYQTDSLLFDTLAKKYFKFTNIIRDTIVYYKYSDITQIDFRNNLKRKADFATLNLSTGVELILLSIILPPILAGGYDGFFNSPLPVFIGTGIILTTTGYLRLRQLQKLKSYSLTARKFIVKDKLK